MEITPDKLTFAFLEELYREYERNPLPNNWVPLAFIVGRVVSKYGNHLASELVPAALNQLYTGQLIKQVNYPDGSKKVQISPAGIDAYKTRKAAGKSDKKEKKEYRLKWLGIIIAVGGFIVVLIKLIFFHQ
jgi:hypothetical protein